MIVIRPDIVILDMVPLQELANTLAERITAHFGYIRNMVAETGHADSIVQFGTADMTGKMFDIFQGTGLIRYEKAHGFTDSEYVAHNLNSILPLRVTIQIIDILGTVTHIYVTVPYFATNYS
jgi:hypothetical protein